MFYKIYLKMSLYALLYLTQLYTSILSIWKMPIRWLSSLNYFRYKRVLTKNPGKYAPSDTFRKEHYYIPKSMHSFWAWSIAERLLYDFSVESLQIEKDFKKITFFHVGTWVLACTNLAKVPQLLVALGALLDNVESVMLLRHDYYRKSVRVWMAELYGQLDPRYPHVEMIRYLYLMGDLSRKDYLKLFEQAKHKDEALDDFSRDQIQPNRVYRFEGGPTKMVNKELDLKYLGIFGEQFEQSFK